LGFELVDELIQIALNPNPTTGNTCSTMYWAMQDANWNVLGLVDSTGALKERYEYTPYGQRTVFFGPGSNDPRCYAATFGSRRFVTTGSIMQPYCVCEFGHQGLMHDEEGSLIYNRARALNSILGVYCQRDPLEYFDAENLYAYLLLTPVNSIDPSGRQVARPWYVICECVTPRGEILPPNPCRNARPGEVRHHETLGECKAEGSLNRLLNRLCALCWNQACFHHVWYRCDMRYSRIQDRFIWWWTILQEYNSCSNLLKPFSEKFPIGPPPPPPRPPMPR